MVKARRKAAARIGTVAADFSNSMPARGAANHPRGNTLHDYAAFAAGFLRATEDQARAIDAVVMI